MALVMLSKNHPRTEHVLENSFCLGLVNAGMSPKVSCHVTFDMVHYYCASLTWANAQSSCLITPSVGTS